MAADMNYVGDYDYISWSGTESVLHLKRIPWLTPKPGGPSLRPLGAVRRH